MGEQSAHATAAAAAENFPGLQVVQRAAPDPGENVPAMQSVHAFEKVPAPALPAGHAVQVRSSDSDVPLHEPKKEPELHVEH